MSAGHTPGPWAYESDHTHRQFNIRMLGHLIGTRAEARHICTVNNLPPHILANRDQSTAEANARLITAAPDLLAALRDVVRASDASDGDSLANAIQAAGATIRKATGNA